MVRRKVPYGEGRGQTGAYRFPRRSRDLGGVGKNGNVLVLGRFLGGRLGESGDVLQETGAADANRGPPCLRPGRSTIQLKAFLKTFSVGLTYDSTLNPQQMPCSTHVCRMAGGLCVGFSSRLVEMSEINTAFV